MSNNQTECHTGGRRGGWGGCCLVLEGGGAGGSRHTNAHRILSHAVLHERMRVGSSPRRRWSDHRPVAPGHLWPPPLSCAWGL